MLILRNELMNLPSEKEKPVLSFLAFTLKRTYTL